MRPVIKFCSTWKWALCVEIICFNSRSNQTFYSFTRTSNKMSVQEVDGQDFAPGHQEGWKPHLEPSVFLIPSRPVGWPAAEARNQLWAIKKALPKYYYNTALWIGTQPVKVILKIITFQFWWPCFGEHDHDGKKKGPGPWSCRRRRQEQDWWRSTHQTKCRWQKRSPRIAAPWIIDMLGCKPYNIVSHVDRNSLIDLQIWKAQHANYNLRTKLLPENSSPLARN